MFYMQNALITKGYICSHKKKGRRSIPKETDNNYFAIDNKIGANYKHLQDA